MVLSERKIKENEIKRGEMGRCKRRKIRRAAEQRRGRERGRYYLAPLLEETHPLTLAIGHPQIATAAGAVAAIVRPVIAIAAAPYATSPIKI